MHLAAITHSIKRCLRDHLTYLFILNYTNLTLLSKCNTWRHIHFSLKNSASYPICMMLFPEHH